jgi:hypothetical protein
MCDEASRLQAESRIDDCLLIRDEHPFKVRYEWYLGGRRRQSVVWSAFQVLERLFSVAVPDISGAVPHLPWSYKPSIGPR